MKLYWLGIMPLVIAAAMAALHRRSRWSLAIGSLGALAGLGLAVRLPLNEPLRFLAQEWLLVPAVRDVLVFAYVTTAILLWAADASGQGAWFGPAALAGIGFLSAALLLRPLWLSFFLLPAAMIAMALSAAPQQGSAVRGASRLLVWATLPIPFMLFVQEWLARLALYPDERVWADLGALLIVLAAALWLNLFPFQDALRRWAEDGLPLGPALLWIVKDTAVLYLLVSLWREVPALYTRTAADALGIAGLVTATVSGIVAGVQTNPAAVLSCAAASQLGIAIQGLAAGSSIAHLAGLSLLTGRYLACLLATCSLAVLPRATVPSGAADRWVPWSRGLATFGFSMGLLAMAGVPPLLGFWGRRQVYYALSATEPYLLLTWILASGGLLLGWMRTLPTLWKARLEQQNAHSQVISSLLVIGLLALYLWTVLRPDDILGLVSVFRFWSVAINR